MFHPQFGKSGKKEDEKHFMIIIILSSLCSTFILYSPFIFLCLVSLSSLFCYSSYFLVNSSFIFNVFLPGVNDLKFWQEEVNEICNPLLSVSLHFIPPFSESRL